VTIVPQIECQANLLRGCLKHSWLENQLLNKTTDEVIYLWEEIGWAALDKEFSERVNEAIYLADDLESGFSPAQLVDHLAPFAKLNQETKVLIKQAVHKAYLKSSKIPDFREPLREAAITLGEALDELRNVWQLPVTEDNEQLLMGVWLKVNTRAKALHTMLERLPKGVVLP